MGVTLTYTGNNIYNVPDDDEQTVSPDDLTVVEATDSRILITAEFEGVDFAVTATGEFAYADTVVGLGLGTASTLISGTLTEVVSEAVSGEEGNREVETYNPGVPWQPVTTLADTLESLEAMYTGNDVFIGDQTIPFSDEASGYAGNDRFLMTYGNPWSEKFHGGDGIDTAVITSEREHWTIERGAVWDIFTRSMTGEGYRITDTRHVDSEVYGEQGHVLELTEVERLEFSDTKMAFDLDGAAGQTAKILAAVFGADAVSVPGYVGVGLSLFDGGQSRESVAALALDFVGAQTHSDVVTLLYTNLFGAAPTALEAQPYIDALDAGVYTKASIAAAAAELTDTLGVIDLVGLADTGIEFA